MGAAHPRPGPRLLILLFLLCSACSGADLQTLPRVSALSFDELKQRISRVRGLPFKEEVLLETKPAEEIQAALQKSFSENDDHLRQLARVYARLGLLPERTDLPKALLQLGFWRNAVRFDAQKNVITVAREPLRPELGILRSPFPGEEATKQILLAHALTHALEEQNFDWERKLRYATLDSGLALRAVKDGDATLTALAQLTGDPKENPQKLVEGLKSIMRSESRVDRALSDVPELLRRELAFSYAWGSQFVMWAYSLKGWAGVNELFSQPPLSTEQLLHPEKYYGKRDDPLQVNPWSLTRRFGGRIIVDENLGEFVIRFLLGRALPSEEAARAAAGWGGDRLLAFEQEKRLVLAWVTAWDNREEAQEFFRSYRKFLERGSGRSFDPFSGNPEMLISLPNDGQAVFLQIKDNCVFFLDGMAPAGALETAEQLWSNLEIRSGTSQLPLDLAGFQSPGSR